jgi:predicted DNA-binding transcriptional regulator AlpA
MQPRECRMSGQSNRAPIATDDEVLLTAQQVCTRLGGISQMTLWRWLGSDAVRFPQPTMRVNKRRFWSAGSIRRWLAERSSGRARSMTAIIMMARPPPGRLIR